MYFMRQLISIYSDNSIWFLWYISNIKTQNRNQVLDRETRMKGFKVGKLDILRSQQIQNHLTERKLKENLNDYGEKINPFSDALWLFVIQEMWKAGVLKNRWSGMMRSKKN